MSEEEARELVKNEGFEIIEFLEQENGLFFFLCETDGEEVEVVVDNGKIIISPT